MQVHALGMVFLLAPLLDTQAATLSQEAELGIHQFNHRGWSEKDGAPEAILAMAQTSDGLLWLGTPSGLFTFDGSSFESIDKIVGHSQAHASVSALAADKDGGLWIGHNTRAGLQYLRNGVLNELHLDDGIIDVHKIVVDPRGIAWVVANHRLWRIDHQQARLIDGSWRLPQDFVLNCLVDASGAVWVETRRDPLSEITTLSRMSTGAAAFVVVGTVLDGDAYFTADGSLWINRVTELLRWPRLADALPQKSLPPGIPLPIAPTGSLLVAPDGAVWAQHRQGLSRYTDFEAMAQVRVPNAQDPPFKTSDGLTSDIVRVLFCDRDGNVWSGTDGGLDRFRRMPITTIPLGGRASGAAIAPAAGGAIWAASFDSKLMRIDRGGRTDYPAIGPDITSLHAGATGSLWVGAENFDVWRTDDGTRFSKLPLPRNGAVKGQIQSLTTDSAGDLWIGMLGASNSFRFADGRWNEVVPSQETARAHRVLSLDTDTAGRVWQSSGDTVLIFDKGHSRALELDPAIGIVETIYHHGQHVWLGGASGLALSDGQQSVTLKANDGQGFETIHGILELANGDVWVHEERDAFVIRASQLTSVAPGSKEASVDVERFDAADGLERNRHTPEPSVVQADDGRLWFSVDRGVACADLAQLVHASRPITVRITSFIADGRAFPVTSSAVVGELNKHAELTFSAIDLSTAEKRRFRYRLEGLEQEWHEAGAHHGAQYNDLPPGDYAFVAQVTDDFGHWQEHGGRLAFTVPPAWFQTAWFRGAVAVLLAVLIGLLHRWRARRVALAAETRVRQQLEIRAAERERIARDLHDTLLQGTTGLVLNFQVALNRLPSGSAERQAMQGLLDEADRSVDEARARVTGLRADATDTPDFVRQLHDVGRSLARQGAIAFALEGDGAAWPLASEVQDQLIMIVREAVGNAAQHAGASRVTVRMAEESRGYALSVVDDGMGFAIDKASLDASARGHWGLFGMRERAREIGAALEIDSQPGTGTRVTVILPVQVAGPWERRYRRVGEWTARAISKLGRRPRSSRRQGIDRQ